MPVSHNSHYSPYPDHSNNIKCTRLGFVSDPKYAQQIIQLGDKIKQQLVQLTESAVSFPYVTPTRVGLEAAQSGHVAFVCFASDG